jgi:signal transduction histidine kinase/PAS domain-containing protein
MYDRLADLAHEAATSSGFAVVHLQLRIDALPPWLDPLPGSRGLFTVALAGSAIEGLDRDQRDALPGLMGVPPTWRRRDPEPRPLGPRTLPAAARRLLPGVSRPRLWVAPLTLEGRLAGLVRVIAPRDEDVAERVHAMARLFTFQLGIEWERALLLRERATYKAFLDNAGDAVLVVDPETGRVLEANLRALELIRCRASELPRLRVGRLIARPGASSRRILAHLAAGDVVRDDELLLRPRAGPPIPVSVTTTRISIGEIPVLHLVIRDLSRERAALAALAQAKETLAALVLAGAHLQEEIEQDRIFEVLSRELARLGFKPTILTTVRETEELAVEHTAYPGELLRVVDRLLGRPLLGARVNPGNVQLLARVIRTGATAYTNRPVELLREMFGGELPRAVLARVAAVCGLEHTVLAPLRFHGAVSGVLIVAAPGFKPGDAEAIDAFALQASIALEKARLYNELKDQAARLESEVERRTRELTLAVRALEDLDRRKDNFLANISHELRTPLVTMLGYNQLMLSEKMGVLQEKQRQALEVSLGNGRRLKAFIEELLDYSRYELTKDRIKFEPFDVRESIAQSLAALAPKTYERNIRMRARVSVRTPIAWGDKDRVVQVLTNLLQNAERFCSEGGIIHVAAARGPDGRVEVAVTDDGAGIAREHLAKIFDRLYQVGDVSRERSSGGLGLGLNIAKSIVEAHGGRMSVWSEPGSGTSFRFSLPSAELVGAEARLRQPA